MARTLVMGLTGSHFVGGAERRRTGNAALLPAAHAFLGGARAFSPTSRWASLGGALKRKEKLSARLGDMLSLLYVCSATLKRYEDEGRQQADAPLMHWAIWDAMFKAQNAFEGVISNFPESLRAMVMRRIVFPLGRPYVVPSDRAGHEVARLLIEPSATRDRLTAGMYMPSNENDPIRRDRARARSDARRPNRSKRKCATR